MKHTHIRGDAPNDNRTKLVSEGYSLRRGKVVPAARANHPQQRGGMGQQVDADMIEAGKQLLDEALK